MGIASFSFIKKGIISFLLLFSTIASYGQFYHGIEVGANLNSATFMIDTSQDPTSDFGFSLGYAAERDLSENLYVKVAILVNKRGLKAVNKRGFNTTDETWGLNVIEVPVNFGYYINYNNRNFQFFIDAGLNFDYNIRAFVENENEKITLDIGGEGDIKRISTGATIGAGILFSKRLKVRLNYYYGLTSVSNNENDEWKNNSFGISFNYFLKKREPY
jgi:hypothetical protein